MELLILSIVFTMAIKHAVEKGGAEYGHVRDQRARQLAADHPDWSPGRVNRVARKAARGYWWDQARRGWPEAKAAYRENKELAEAARVEAETAGLKRRADIRERIRKALEEADRIRKQEQARWLDDDEALPDAPWKKAEEKPETANEDHPHALPEETPNPDAADGHTCRWVISEQGSRPLCGLPAEPGSVYCAGHKREFEAGFGASEAEAAPEPAPAEHADADPDTKPDGEGAGPREPAGPATGGDAQGATVIPMNRPRATAPATTAIEGESDMTALTGEVAGYEQTLAEYEADVTAAQGTHAYAEKMHAAANDLIGNLESKDAAYERRMAQLRSLNADDTTIEHVAQLREANEGQLTAARETANALAQQLEGARNAVTAATEARDSWVSRQGSVKDTRDATQVRGDDAIFV